jgi:G3E family GTPase
MIPLCLVTGFLGSGKTSMLRHLARRHPDRKLVYLVNEFSAVDVDGRLLEADAQHVIAVPGGSIFCVCLVSEFIRILRDIPERFGQTGGPVQGVVIEASGIANPKVIGRMLNETRLDEVYRIASIVAVVDPATFPALLQTLPNIRAQVEACGYALLNKTDLFSEEALGRCEHEIRRINPDAQIIRTQYGAVDLELFREFPARALDGEYAACLDPNFARVSVRLTRAVDLDRLCMALRGLGAGLYRAKGFLPTPAGVYYLDATASDMRTRPVDRPGAAADLALIVCPDRAGEARRLAAEIKAGVYDAPPGQTQKNADRA